MNSQTIQYTYTGQVRVNEQRGVSSLEALHVASLPPKVQASSGKGDECLSKVRNMSENVPATRPAQHFQKRLLHGTKYNFTDKSDVLRKSYLGAASVGYRGGVSLLHRHLGSAPETCRPCRATPGNMRTRQDTGASLSLPPTLDASVQTCSQACTQMLAPPNRDSLNILCKSYVTLI